MCTMDKQNNEQKIFHRYNRTVEVCGKCGGTGKILVYDEDDLCKYREPKEETCPLCEGAGMLNKTVTITTDLSPFKR